MPSSSSEKLDEVLKAASTLTSVVKDLAQQVGDGKRAQDMLAERLAQVVARVAGPSRDDDEELMLTDKEKKKAERAQERLKNSCTMMLRVSDTQKHKGAGIDAYVTNPLGNILGGGKKAQRKEMIEGISNIMVQKLVHKGIFEFSCKDMISMCFQAAIAIQRVDKTRVLVSAEDHNMKFTTKELSALAAKVEMRNKKPCDVAYINHFRAVIKSQMNDNLVADACGPQGFQIGEISELRLAMPATKISLDALLKPFADSAAPAENNGEEEEDDDDDECIPVRQSRLVAAEADGVYFPEEHALRSVYDLTAKRYGFLGTDDEDFDEESDFSVDLLAWIIAVLQCKLRVVEKKKKQDTVLAFDDCKREKALVEAIDCIVDWLRDAEACPSDWKPLQLARGEIEADK